MEKDNIPLAYAYIFKDIKKIARGEEIDKKEVLAMLGYNHKLPREIRACILDEMQTFGMIHLTSKKIKLLNINVDKIIKNYRENIREQILIRQEVKEKT